MPTPDWFRRTGLQYGSNETTYRSCLKNAESFRVEPVTQTGWVEQTGVDRLPSLQCSRCAHGGGFDSGPRGPETKPFVLPLFTLTSTSRLFRLPPCIPYPGRDVHVKDDAYWRGEFRCGASGARVLECSSQPHRRADQMQ